jgi:dTDP-3,4-didehydro-2,6-dideoxy-alpha-D-glucose 3-reductase
MRLLILGYSSIVQRRVLPAAAKVEAIEQISIASRSRPEPEGGWPKRGRFFADYDTALRDSNSDLVYLSLPNAMHEYWVLAALARGKHVLVDKPAMTTREACERGVSEARRAGLMLAEATVFACHPHFEALQGFVAENGRLTHVDAQFIIPPLPSANFRNHTKLGGGCLLDMGPYAAALMRILGGGAPLLITGLAGSRHPETGVDMGFSVQARLANGGIFSGHFSFEGEYQNRLLIVAHSGSVMIERVFSPPADHSMEWRRRAGNVETVVTFEAADIFARFLDAATGAISGGDREPWYRDLLADAQCRARITDAILLDTPTLVKK